MALSVVLDRNWRRIEGGLPVQRCHMSLFERGGTFTSQSILNSKMKLSVLGSGGYSMPLFRASLDPKTYHFKFMLLVLIDSLSSQTEEQDKTNTCSLNNNLTLHAPFHISISAMMSLTCLFSLAPLWELSALRQLSALLGPNDVASRSPRVKGENSENRVFWSVREDLPALFCILDFGPGVMEGRRGGGQEHVRVKRAMGEEWLVQLRTNNRKNASWAMTFTASKGFCLCVWL